ncbi:ATP-binding protein [Cupriavidus sp. a3]|uniref:ATP-binding protein n=1 Tax=Cupriavidus sp. a3 TaxID=3242158 RepID=UPI003D9C1472
MKEKVFPVRLDRMLESLRYAEYDMSHGMGEAIDNSVEAGAADVWVFTENEIKKLGSKSVEVISQIAVVDNGEGMSKDVLHRCLVLGESLRQPKPSGKSGIGRFGVGMTLGAISLGRRVEVYARSSGDEPFLFTYIDLDEIANKTQVTIPEPHPKDPPGHFNKLLADSGGTVVIISNCDRLQTAPVEYDKPISASDQIKPLMGFLGRTYRKFIDAGRNFWLNGEPVFLHDPLYLMEPTYPEHKAGKLDIKAKLKGETEFELAVPNMPGKTAKVKLKLTLLPKEWRSAKNSGGTQFARDRKIHENEGVSILRADREVLYGTVPFILGKKGQARSLEIDRWWGLEISFPPELDEYFHVRYIKRGAEPIASLRDKIREQVWRAVKELREEISRDLNQDPASKDREQGVFADAESAMAEAETILPKGKRGVDTPPEEAERQLGDVANQDIFVASPEQKEQKKNELKSKPFSIVPVTFPKNVFFETEHILGKIIVKLNVQHPFYKEVFEPLCGTISSLAEDSKLDEGADTEEKIQARRALLLLILSYAKAESFFDDNDDVFTNLRSQWGVALATAIKS